MKRSRILFIALVFLIGLVGTTYANVYATKVAASANLITTSELSDDVEISFLLNEDADLGVDVKFFNGDMDLVRTITLATATKGVVTVVWDGKDGSGNMLSDGDYTFEVVAKDDGYSDWTKISDDMSTVMYSPKGLVINRDPASPHFGKVYIANGYAGTSGNAGAFYNDDGVYMFDASQDLLGFSAGGHDWSGSSNTPGKMSIGEDDRVYVTEYGSDELFVFDGDISTASAVKALDATNRIDGQYISANWVTGSGEDRIIYIANAHYAAGEGIRRYEIGLNDTMPTGDTGTLVIERPNGSYYQTDVEVDSQGNIYFCQLRGDYNQAIPILKYNPYAGTTLTIDDTLWTLGMDVAYGAQGIGLDEERNILAWGNEYSGNVLIHDATTGAILDTIATGQGRSKDVAFDAAGNLYTIDNNTEYWHVWSPAGANEFTSPGNATITIDTAVPVSSVFINEFDTKSSSSEYIELYNSTDTPIDLAAENYVLVCVNGYDDQAYQATELTGTIPAYGFYVIAESGVTDLGGYTPDQNASWTSFQNGTDGVALVKGASAADFPGAAVFSTEYNAVAGAFLESAIVYGESDDVADPGLETELSKSGILILSDGAGSSSRISDGRGGFDYTNDDWMISEIRTPGITNVLPAQIVKAVPYSETEIEVFYSTEMMAANVADYSLLGTAGVTFASADVDLVDAQLVHLVATEPIPGDVILDTLIDASIPDTLELYAGITPIALTNTASASKIAEDMPATFRGLVTANDAYNNVWINDGNKAYQGILIFDYDFPDSVAVGDEIMISASLTTYNNLTELVDPVVLGVKGKALPTHPARVRAEDLEKSIAADTNPAEQWEGQLVTVFRGKVMSYDAANYVYELRNPDGIRFLVGDNVDYHFGSITLNVGDVVNVTGVVDFTDGAYRVNPRGMEDVRPYFPPGNIIGWTFEDAYDVPPWAGFVSTGWSIPSFVDTGGVDGSGGLWFSDGGYGFFAKRPIQATVGGRYVITVDVKTAGWDDAETYPITIGIEGLSSPDTLNTVNINGTTDFTTIVLTGVADNAEGFIKIEGSNTLGHNDVWIDNLVFHDNAPNLDLRFESPLEVSMWNEFVSTGWTIPSHDPVGGVDGSGALYFSDGGYALYAARPVAATPGTYYSLQATIKTLAWDDAETYPITFGIEGLDAEPVEVNINAFTDYTTVYLEGIAASAEGYIFIDGSNTLGHNDVWIDNLKFKDNVTLTSNEVSALPENYALHNAYPNPFNPVTNINYELPENAHVVISVYNMVGQHVVDLVDNEQAAGYYQKQWNGLDKSGAPVASGVYLYRMTTPGFTQTQKVLFLK
ncbi:MAG: lamin tail domain-containing protein [Candidatus Marinimicrobia bacterium]|nr:lamin tail domain-containing protein [Candidatus Neomarinimicrobiota bacterium]MCF7851066.1 lamin tail domain-containing protein [Candidatus Neomarinimicrobiota bacterium]MCF7904036.1 lamin tail domain-containing protein [Candidatus Neomarinimicrobiota bacterium]